ncbi:putative inactive peptidyl-prolyl cis-trans isomerase-like 6 [Entophlyctis luteolus]|nr:putative inactive peptidyl-prolyl cis-trans isomerase-like 6 [Entophlyctis luteolus]
MKQEIAIIGNVKTSGFQKALKISKKLETFQPRTFTINVTTLTPIEYLENLDALKQHIKHLVPSLFPGAIIQIKDGDESKALSVPQFAQWAKQKYDIEVGGSDFGDINDDQVEAELEKIGTREFENFIKSLQHTIVYFDVQVGAASGRLWFELYNDVVPQSVAHFLSFINGTAQLGSQTLSFEKSNINRIVKEGWFQAGEILHDDGTPLVGTVLPDENFVIPHAHRGNISFVNSGPHSNFSQFMVTMRPLPYFDRKFVCIGRCIDGDEMLQAIDNAKTRHEKPTVVARILQSGVFCEGPVVARREFVPGFF